MKKPILLFVLFSVVSLLLSCNSETKKIGKHFTDYTPIDQKIYDEIVAMDKDFFTAYNTCDLEKQAFIYANDIEFFHDKGGLMTSKEELIEGTKQNICGKVTRELVDGSIEVYPINTYGAVEIGYHKFFNNQEPDAVSVPSKFIIMWKNENDTWKITKVVSLH